MNRSSAGLDHDLRGHRVVVDEHDQELVVAQVGERSLDALPLVPGHPSRDAGPRQLLLEDVGDLTGWPTSGVGVLADVDDIERARRASAVPYHRVLAIAGHPEHAPDLPHAHPG